MKKNIFFVLKKRWIISCCFLLSVIISISMYFAFKTEYVIFSPKGDYTVVIDAGHGGIDGGSVGVNTKVKESDLNLKYALNLANQLDQMGIYVILTRSNSDGLYDISAKNLKKSEMLKRKEIIETSNADIVVSIHMNSYPLSSSRGAQTFYRKDNELGKSLAESIQSQLFENLEYAKKNAKSGDYYMVNCTDLPSVIVECGFLSNSEEELLLQKVEYQNKVCYNIMCGILNFLNEI